MSKVLRERLGFVGVSVLEGAKACGDGRMGTEKANEQLERHMDECLDVCCDFKSAGRRMRIVGVRVFGQKRSRVRPALWLRNYCPIVTLHSQFLNISIEC